MGELCNVSSSAVYRQTYVDYESESYIPTNTLLYKIIYWSQMSVLKHLKTLQHVSIIIQIIFRELVGSLLKSLNLKVFIRFFFKIVEIICGNVAA